VGVLPHQGVQLAPSVLPLWHPTCKKRTQHNSNRNIRGSKLWREAGWGSCHTLGYSWYPLYCPLGIQPQHNDMNGRAKHSRTARRHQYHFLVAIALKYN
jgi:hypothetical protein